MDASIGYLIEAASANKNDKMATTAEAMRAFFHCSFIPHRNVHRHANANTKVKIVAGNPRAPSKVSRVYPGGGLIAKPSTGRAAATGFRALPVVGEFAWIVKRLANLRSTARAILPPRTAS
jgi:hypothetical protein